MKTVNHSEITNETVNCLIVGESVEFITEEDMSDHILYGRKHKRKLKGELRNRAIAAGAVPVVYQSIYWFCIAFIPMSVHGTYYVLPMEVTDQQDACEFKYRVVPAPYDSQQVWTHRLLGVFTVGFSFLLFWLLNQLL